jgi:sigma-B regulation protein RsbU (phosphoserine phosphatase)
LLARANGSTEEFGEPGTLLGVFAEAIITERTTLLRPGDALALYTDGLSDAHAPERTLTAEEMLSRLSRSAPCPAREAISALLELVDLERGARDDIAILAASVQPAGNGHGPATGR